MIILFEVKFIGKKSMRLKIRKEDGMQNPLLVSVAEHASLASLYCRSPNNPLIKIISSINDTGNEGFQVRFSENKQT